MCIHSLKGTCSEIHLCLLQSGHNIAQLREKMRELVKQIIHMYSAAKTFPYILEGLRSRNNRTRIESVDLVGFLLDNHASEVKFVVLFKFLFLWFTLENPESYVFFILQIGGQLKSLQIVASLTSERDGEIRKVALNTLATGYKILGELSYAFFSLI